MSGIGESNLTSNWDELKKGGPPCFFDGMLDALVKNFGLPKML
jgi:hypothetical protein